MKKNLLYLFTILCTLSFVTSCSDEDDDKALNAWKNLATDYTGANLTLTVNGTAVTDKKIELDAISADSATIAMTDVVAEVAYVGMGVKLTRNTNGYDISGSKNISGFVVSVTGKVTDDSKMTLAVTTKGWDVADSDFTGEKLELKINDQVVADKAVSFKKTSEAAAVVTLKNVIYGKENLEVPVRMVISKSEAAITTYDFSGSVTDSEAGYNVHVVGTINTASGAMTMNVTTENWVAISNVYSGDSLAVRTNGVPQSSTSFPVTLVASSDTKATLTFDKIVNVANDYPIDVTLTKEGNDYKIAGEKLFKEGYLISLTGKLSNNVLTIDITTSGYALALKSYSGDNLQMIYNGSPKKAGMFGQMSVDLNGTSMESVKVILTGVVPGIYENGAASLIIENMKLEDKGAETYSIAGETTYGSSTITFKGTVSPEKVLTISVDQKIISPVVGRWNIEQQNGMAKVLFSFESATGEIEVPAALKALLPNYNLPDKMGDAALSATISGLLGQYVPYLKYIEFKEDGSIEAGYSEIGSTVVAKLDSSMLNYVVKDDILTLTPNINSLIPSSLDQTRAFDPSSLLAGGGFPFHLSVSGNSLALSLDKEVIAPTVSLVTVMFPVIAQIAKLDEQTTEMITSILTPVNDVVQSSKKFDVGLYFTK